MAAIAPNDVDKMYTFWKRFLRQQHFRKKNLLSCENHNRYWVYSLAFDLIKPISKLVRSFKMVEFHFISFDFVLCVRVSSDGARWYHKSFLKLVSFNFNSTIRQNVDQFNPFYHSQRAIFWPKFSICQHRSHTAK